MSNSRHRTNALGLALRASAVAHAAEIGTQLVRAGRGHHAGVHRARKALTRLRALLALLRAAPVPPTHLERRARAIARSLSQLRNAQAAYGTARRLSRAADSPDAHAAWRTALGAIEAERDLLLDAELSSDVDFVARRRRFAALQASLHAYDWSVVKSGSIEAAFARSRRRVRREREQARKTHTQAQRHRLRRRLRRLLLQADLLREIADATDTRAAKRARKLIVGTPIQRHPCKRLVDALGEERDLQLLRSTLLRLPLAGQAGLDHALYFVDKRLPQAASVCDKLIN